MLAFLDALCASLLARHSIEIFRLLGLPAARKLPREVREEAVMIAKAGPDSFLAPVQALHLYYKLSHLVDESAELSGDERADQPPAYSPQMEFSFRVRKVS
ncbi:MAG TPA: hypothetical protein VNU46_00865 [Gemmatimonadaceae bacterium]|jgi:hypothetical protein|nr:hypothetical protein [Gemmatimonadaceae bacterium]